MLEMQQHWLFNAFMQTGLVAFTMAGFLMTSLKLPEYGLLLNLVAQIFWFYSAYRAWKEANQYGILINTILLTIIIAAGVINYWIL